MADSSYGLNPIVIDLTVVGAARTIKAATNDPFEIKSIIVSGTTGAAITFLRLFSPDVNGTLVFQWSGAASTTVWSYFDVNRPFIKMLSSGLYMPDPVTAFAANGVMLIYGA